MVARVVDGIEERRSASLIDGRPGLSLDVVKQSGANTVEVADGIDKAVGGINCRAAGAHPPAQGGGPLHLHPRIG